MEPLTTCDTVLELQSITKTYRKTAVVQQYSLQLKRGHILGLIGPNGAGKTTVMRMLAGLTAPASGNILLFGDQQDLKEQRKRISFMIEVPALDGNMTAYENMEYVRYIRGIAEKENISQILTLVGLSDTGKKLVRHFSLGMRQRLGIAIALLSKPEILVLDEPVNGLDPEGIVATRKLLQQLSIEQNVSILISSHLLSELSELCDEFIIMNHGKIIDCLSAEELWVKCRHRLTIQTDRLAQTAAVLENTLDIHNYKVVHNNEIHIFERLNEIETISKAITDSGLIITKLVLERESLEEYYLAKVGEIDE